MQPDARLLGTAAIVLVALAVPVLLVSRALPPRTSGEVVAAEDGSLVPVPLVRTRSGSQRLEADTPRFPALRRARVRVEVATYLQVPSQTIHFDLLGPRGERIGACDIPPSDYHDNGPIECPIGRPQRLRRIVVEAAGRAPLALYAVNDGGPLVAGALVRERHLSSLAARLRVLRSRVEVTRPELDSAVLLFVLLAASIGLFGAAWLVAGNKT